MDTLPGGFKALPVKFSASSTAVHHMYFKGHHVRQANNEKPNDRTLFIINVPSYCNEACFQRLFSVFGEIENIFFQRKPSAGLPPNYKDSTFFSKNKQLNGYKLAYVVFKDKLHLEAVLTSVFLEPFILSTKEHPVLVGIQKWSHEYNTHFPDVAAMQTEIDSFMAAYDEKIKEQLENEKAQEGVPDKDGWITVTRHGRRPVIPRKDALEKKITVKDKKKRAQKELLNFYTFQIRETKMEHIAKLRKKFEEDRQRIALMKAARKFRPF